MTVVTVAGHGGWDRDELASRGEENWITATMPVYFFTENMKQMWGLLVKGGSPGEADILASTDAADLLALADQGLFSRKVDAGSGCLNYVVGDDQTSDDLVAGDDVIIHHGGEYSLKNIMDEYPDAEAIFWCCCSAIMLNEVGGEALGVDALQHVGPDANQSAQSDWQKYDGDFDPQGVQRCDATCAECGGACRWGVEHRGQYDHQCEQGHTFTDDQAGLGIDRLAGDAPTDGGGGWQSDPDWQTFVDRLLDADEETARQMWGELGFDTQSMLKEDSRVATWAQGAGV